MARQLDQELRQVWRERIERQPQSGLTVTEFCRREQVSAANFYSWKRKLRNQPCGPPNGTGPQRPTAPARHRRRKASATASKAAFVQLPLPAAAASPWIEVVLAEGTVVRIPQQNLAALQTVLRALNGAASTPARREVRYA